MRKLNRISLCLGIVLSGATAYADVSAPLPPFSKPGLSTQTSQKLKEKKIIVLPTGRTSLTLDYDKSIPLYPTAILKQVVSCGVEDGSFLKILDALVASADTTCKIECRKVKPIRINFATKDTIFGDALSGLAKSVGAQLYVLPSKLLVCDPSLLSQNEKELAIPFSTAITAAEVPLSSQVGSLTDGKGVLHIANTKISFNVASANVHDALNEIFSQIHEPMAAEFTASSSMLRQGRIDQNFTFSMEHVSFLDALNVIASATGTEVFLLPGKFLIAAPEDLSTQEKHDAIPAFHTNSKLPSVKSS